MTKTFDQLLLEHSPEEMLRAEVSAPSAAIRSYLAMEPVAHQGVVRVALTARDEHMRVLWATMISAGMLPPGQTTPVALYSAVRQLVSPYLETQLSPPAGPRHELSNEPYRSIEYCVNEIQALLRTAIAKTNGVKNKSVSTDDRAKWVSDVLWDTLLQLTHGLAQTQIQTSDAASEEAQ